jgi:hypothetical protein
MKKLSLTTLLILITLGFSSCSQDDSTILEDAASAQNLLKSFNLNKSSNGDYSLGYQLNNGVAADNVRDEKTNTSNIYLYSAETSQRRSLNEELILQDGQLKVSFNDTNKEEVHTITVLDDDIKSRGEENTNLENWGITGNDDGTYDLNFEVKEGIEVDFIYDGDRNVYEVHLMQNEEASQSDFVQTFSKQDDLALKIEFLNYSTSRTTSQEASLVKKPKIIMD